VNLLTSWGWEILPHPPHSPDFNRQTSMFPKMEKHFHSNEDFQNEVKKWLCALNALFL
jgi:transposase